MTAVQLLGVAASTAGVLLGLAPAAQIRLIVRRGTSDGVSVAYWLILVGAMTLWLAYGIAADNIAIIVANIVSVVTAVAMVVTVWSYRPRGD